MTLLLIMLLSVLFSIWAAFIYSLRLTKPVRELLEGTMAVASDTSSMAKEKLVPLSG